MTQTTQWVARPESAKGVSMRRAWERHVGWHALSPRRAWERRNTPFEDSGRATLLLDSFMMRNAARNSNALICIARIALAASLFVCANAAFAQDEPAIRILDRDPFDRITLDEANGNAVLDVFPLTPQDRATVANPQPAAKIRIRMLSQPEREFDLAVRSIGKDGNVPKVEYFEQFILRDADQLVAQGKTNEAFEYFDFLVQKYPKAAGLEQSLQSYLYTDAGLQFRAGNYDDALAVLEELYSQNPDYRSTSQVLGTVVDKVIERYAADKNYSAARKLIARIDRQYRDKQQAVVAKWQQQLSQVATAKRDEARRFLESGESRAARDASQQMMDIWPSVAGAAELFAEISRRYPLIVVGVTQPGSIDDPQRVDNWAARRTGRLTQRLLFEFIGYGPEGGQYACPLGTLETSEDGLQLTLRLRRGGAGSDPTGINGYDISRRLLALAEPASSEYRPAWSQLMAGVRVQDVMQVEIDLRRPHVLPTALMQIRLEPSSGVAAGEPGFGPYVEQQRTATEVRFIRNARYAAGAAAQRTEIEERYFAEPRDAVDALRRGEIDALDRVSPSDAERLRSDSSLVVGQYDLPTVHLLVPNTSNPYLANRTFRRALVYGISREAILNAVVLRGASIPGSRVVSGPFPAGDGQNEALAYAYDETILPRPYDPQLAFTLVQLAEQELITVAEKRGEPPPTRPTFVLGHPADDTIRAVCEAMVKQLDPIGIRCELKELPLGVTDDVSGECDLLYVEAAMWEPVVDARRLLAADGIVKSEDPYVGLALRQLDGAKNWQQARLRLRELHRMTHSEVSVIPLWQTVNYFAVRTTLRGVATRPVAFYQDVENWQITPRPLQE
jgi:ABC-type transport system substrate-binding protein/tetratricopeptide (TPR) repeat protein